MIYEIKFDGYRALALRGGNETRSLSRNQKDLGKKFTEVRDSIAALDVQDAVIDGEIVALDDKGRSSFQLLQGFDASLVRAANRLLRIPFAAARRQGLRGLPIESERRSWLTPEKPTGERKDPGALLVGVYQDGRLKFAGRVGPGFSEKLLKSLAMGLTHCVLPWYYEAVSAQGSVFERCIYDPVFGHAPSPA